ncbi:MAG: Uroporphyrinogen deCOase protein, partial [Candidatus Poribacteria bacterium]|nr:Uroporphyrinogen deCOase protein [Candidatus Poribacteria bacterium]
AVRFGPPLYSDSGFQTKEWQEHHSDETYPLLMKEYITPKGNLKQIVRKHEYPSDSVGLFSDHNVPSSRSLKYLIEKEDDLEKLEYILRPPGDEDLRWYREQAKIARKFCDEKQVLFAGYLQGIGDPLLWMSGIDTVVMSSVLNPGFLKHYTDIVSRWNKALLEIQIEAGIDLIIRRGWYESTDFWAPDLFREFLFEPLKQEIEMAHQAGVYFTYVMNSKAKPMLNIFRDLGFDIYSNIDPVTADMDLADLKREIGDSITLYGGVNNFLVVENGSIEEVRKAVIEAVEKLAPGGGFVLGVGDVLDFLFANPETTERNFYEMIKVWKEVWT